MAFRVLFAVTAFYNLDIDQMDIKTVFFYDLINQLIYIEIPKGTKIDDMVFKLFKALYGLK